MMFSIWLAMPPDAPEVAGGAGVPGVVGAVFPLIWLYSAKVIALFLSRS